MAKYRLGDIAPICQGVVPDSDQYWLLNLDVVESGTGKILEYIYVDHSQIGASTIAFDQKNVLYSKLRPYLNKVVLPKKAGFATSEMLPLKPNEQIITREYLTYFLRSPFFLGYINGKTSGAKMPRANTSDLKEFELECPSISEQNRIVAQLNIIDTIIANRQQELSALDDLIKARFVEMFGNPFDTRNPSKWPQKTIREVAESISDGSNVDKSIYKDCGDVLFLRIQNVWCNEFRLEDSVYISKEENEYYKDTSLKHGDLLITKIGRYYTSDSSLGRVSVYLGDHDKANYSNNIMRVRLTNEVNSEYVNILMNLNDYNQYIRRTSVGGTDKRALSKGLIERYPIIVPPIDEQNEFVSFIHQVDKSKDAVKKSLAETQLLFDSLMQNYFGQR